MPAPYAGVWCSKMLFLQPFPEDSFISPQARFLLQQPLPPPHMNSRLFYVHVPSPLGSALVVFDTEGTADKKGTVVYVAIGEWHSLVATMKRDFHKLGVCPRAEMMAGNRARASAVADIAAFLASPTEAHRQEISHKYLFGTELQQRVWREIEAIPPGKSVTYTQLAARVGLGPSSARVVANAVGANRLAVVVPCHRVKRSDGGDGGFRWGLQIKRSLIEREKVLLREGETVKTKVEGEKT
ncbi:hypothetical protein CJJ07_005394 [Candidozyma auris]|nr:hypothetical protein CJJ07_005394 [[Candida] auris]